MCVCVCGGDNIKTVGVDRFGIEIHYILLSALVCV